MSTAAQEYKSRKLKEAGRQGKLAKKTRQFNRCSECGRSRSYISQFGMCRICVRQNAHKGLLPGVTKASW